MASRFVLLSRAAIRSPASGGLLRRASAGPSTLGTVTPAAHQQGLRHYAGGPSSKAGLNKAVANVQRAVNNIEAKLGDVERRLDAFEARSLQGQGDKGSRNLWIGAGYGLVAGILLHFWLVKLVISTDQFGVVDV